MQIWVSESAGRKEFTDFIRDTQKNKPVLLCEVRLLMNSLVINSSAIVDPTSQKYSNTLKPMGTGVRNLLNELDDDHLIIHSLVSEQAEPDITIFIMHNPKDAESLYRINNEESYSRSVKRDSNIYNNLKHTRRDRILLLDYEERFRDLVTIKEDDERGVILSIPTSSYENRLGIETDREDEQVKRTAEMFSNLLNL